MLRKSELAIAVGLEPGGNRIKSQWLEPKSSRAEAEASKVFSIPQVVLQQCFRHPGPCKARTFLCQLSNCFLFLLVQNPRILCFQTIWLCNPKINAALSAAVLLLSPRFLPGLLLLLKHLKFLSNVHEKTQNPWKRSKMSCSRTPERHHSLRQQLSLFFASSYFSSLWSSSSSFSSSYSSSFLPTTDWW